MINVTVQNKLKFQVNITEKTINIDGKDEPCRIEKISGSRYHLIINNRSIEGELIETDAGRRRATWRISGKLIHTAVKDETDMIIDEIGLGSRGESAHPHVDAPMPGLIVDLFVDIGDQVNKGDPLLVLKAMKMENIIRSSASGTIRKIFVTPGQSVEKHSPLVQF
jgi:biotin carboxyl carrier protein